MTEPLVSICIPVYNAEKFIHAAITSALSQTHKNIEVIVLDDASTDETANICRAFSDKIKYMKNDSNMGIGFGRMKLVHESKGDYIAFCSADDILSSDFVELMLKEAEPDKILYCGFFVADELGKVLDQFIPKSFDEHDDFCVACFESATRQTMFVNFSCILVPKKVFEKVDFDPGIRYGEDLDFLLRSMKHFRYKCIPKPLVKYRRHAEMVTLKKWNSIEENNRKIVEKWIKYWRDGP